MRFVVVEPLLMIQKTCQIFFPVVIVAKTTRWQSSHCIAEHGVALPSTQRLEIRAEIQEHLLVKTKAQSSGLKNGKVTEKS